MKRLLLVVAMACVAIGVSTAGRAGDAGAGKAVFQSAKPACRGCHTDAKNPLTRVGADNTAEELTAWIRTPKEMMTRKGRTGTMPSYPPSRISDADLDHLVAYLATLK